MNKTTSIYFGLSLMIGLMSLRANAQTPKPVRAEAETSAPLVVRVDAAAQTVNVMKNALPEMPKFPALPLKPGLVRGYVYDTQGHPLKGAVIGVRSTAAGGFYSGASGKSDAKGYYEVNVPYGVASYYCAGYAVDYGEGRAGLGLHPADDEAGEFASPKGAVKNWVLLPYGIADRDGMQDNPRYINNYHGGGLVLDYRTSEDADANHGGALPCNATLEILLTPDGTLVDGSAGRSIKIIRNVGTAGFAQLYVNNIPAGRYRLCIQLANGTKLHMKETGPYGKQEFGLDPKEAQGETTLLFRPGGAKAESALAGHGNWSQVCISISR